MVPVLPAALGTLLESTTLTHNNILNSGLAKYVHIQPEIRDEQSGLKGTNMGAIPYNILISVIEFLTIKKLVLLKKSKYELSVKNDVVPDDHSR